MYKQNSHNYDHYNWHYKLLFNISRVFETGVPGFLQDKNHEIYKEITVQE